MKSVKVKAHKRVVENKRIENYHLELNTKGMTRKEADTKVAIAQLYCSSPYLSLKKKTFYVNQISGVKIKKGKLKFKPHTTFVLQDGVHNFMTKSQLKKRRVVK